MPQPRRTAGYADRYLVAEVALVILLFAFAVGFFLIPAAEPPFAPSWWEGILLAFLFFAIVIVDTMRRRRGSKVELHRMLEEPEEDVSDDSDTVSRG